MDEYNIDHANNYPKDIYLDCNGIAVLSMLYNVKYVIILLLSTPEGTVLQ